MNDIQKLIATLRKIETDSSGGTHASASPLLRGAQIAREAADTLESVYRDSLTGQAEHARWQERAEAAEDGLFRVVKALGFDTDGAPNADGFFGPMTYCTEDARYTTPADIAVAYATDYRAEMEEEADSIQFSLDLERVHGKKYVESERDRYRAAIETALQPQNIEYGHIDIALSRVHDILSGALNPPEIVLSYTEVEDMQ